MNSTPDPRPDAAVPPAVTPAGRPTLLGRLNRAFALDVPPDKLAGVVAAVRVVTGLMLVHYYLDVLGAASVAGPLAPEFRRRALWVVSLAACLTAGLFTPAAVVGLIVLMTPIEWFGTLGDQITVILLWGLLMLGAGRAWSADALLARVAAARPLMRVLYAAAVPPTPVALGWVRFGLLMLFWGCCVSAMMYHFSDDFWWDSHVLEVVFAMSYMCDHAEAMAAFRDRAPQAYVAVCAAGLIIQGAWELFLVPLMLFRVGRVFACAQGILFFTGSLVLFNLQYLPVAEFILWALIFVPWAWARPLPAAAAAPGGRRAGLAGAFALACAGFFAAQLALCPATTPDWWGRRVAKAWVKTRHVWRYMGQSPVCVFNKVDMEMGKMSYVVHEVDARGNHLRTAPYLDDAGGRLSYLRNDLVYFRNSLPWQRFPPEWKFADGDLSRPTAAFQDMFRRFAVYDALMTGGGGPRHYRVEFYSRDLVIARPATWSPHAHVGRYAVTVDADALAAAAADGWPVFQLPPGHVGQEARLRRTDETMKSLNPPESQP